MLEIRLRIQETFKATAPQQIVGLVRIPSSLSFKNNHMGTKIDYAHEHGGNQKQT
jgi:hypothetical protein